MISNLHTNYEAICKCFDFNRKNTADANKRVLLRMARRNEPRPTQKSGSLGARLCAYTNPNNVVYDEKFTKKIKGIRPEWFVTIEERMDRNKKLFLKMAKRGDPRPNKKTHPLGAIFCSYVNPSQKSTYDEVFTKKIKDAAPHWFIKKYDLAKEKILKLASDRKQKKPTSGELGTIFKELMRPDRGENAKFIKAIKNKRPEWFVSQSENKNKLQCEIIRLANLGLTKKQILKKVGRKFLDYLRDDKFRKKLKQIRSDLFITRSDLANEKKKKILFLAKKNIKPPKHLINCMYQWFHKDKKFAEEFRKINTKWYKSKKQRELEIKENKEKIISMAIRGKRPTKTHLESLYKNSINKNSNCYDPKFRSRLIKIRPEWFKK